MMYPYSWLVALFIAVVGGVTAWPGMHHGYTHHGTPILGDG